MLRFFNLSLHICWWKSFNFVFPEINQWHSLIVIYSKISLSWLFPSSLILPVNSQSVKYGTNFGLILPLKFRGYTPIVWLHTKFRHILTAKVCNILRSLQQNFSKFQINLGKLLLWEILETTGGVYYCGKLPATPLGEGISAVVIWWKKFE